MRARSIVGTADTDEDGDASPFDEIERAANRERPIYG
jgi:hypothetical protein